MTNEELIAEVIKLRQEVDELMQLHKQEKWIPPHRDEGVDSFCEQVLVIKEGESVEGPIVYLLYVDFCKDSQYDYLVKSVFDKEMKQLGYRRGSMYSKRSRVRASCLLDTAIDPQWKELYERLCETAGC